LREFKRLIFLLILFSCCFHNKVFSQSKYIYDLENNVILNQESPYLVTYTFLANLQEDHWHPEVAYKTLRPTMKYADSTQLMDLAIKLKQILDGKGVYINLDKVPKGLNYFDTTYQSYRYTLTERYPLIYLEKVDNKWFISGHTVNSIAGLHQDVFPFGSHRIVNLLKKSGTGSFLGLFIWQYVGILLFAILGIILYVLLTYFFTNILASVLKRITKRNIAKRIINKLARPLSLLIVFFTLFIFIPVLQFPVLFNKYSVVTLRAAMALSGTLIFYKLADVISAYMELHALKTENTMDDQLVPLIRKVLKVFIVILGLIFVLQNLEVNVTALLAGLSIGGLALALAAQDTVKNLFGSTMIFLDRPFQVGDYIMSDQIDGTVEEVGFRSTRIRSFNNSVISIPNGRLADMTIDNMGLREFRRYNTLISLTYDTPTLAIENFVKGLEKIVLDHPNTRKDLYNINFKDLGAVSLDILLNIFFKVENYTEELKARQEINLEILKLAESLNVEFAFPTQTLHFDKLPGIESLKDENIKSDYDAKLKAFLASRNTKI
jgi:MscS family membrane protein